MNNLPHYDILIATIGTSMTNDYVRSLTKTIEELTVRGISYKWLNGFGSLDHNTREATLTNNGLDLNPDDKGPLGDKCTYNKIFWINGNISWDVKDFIKLYEASEEIVTGAYLVGDGFYTTIKQRAFDYLAKGEVIQLRAKKKKVKIESTKFGFIAINKGVYERIDRPWHNVLPTGNMEDTDEDSWCMKVKHLGIDMFLDPTVLVSNTVSGEIKWK